MSIKDQLKRIPLIASAHQRVKRVARNRATNRVVAQLQKTPYARGRQVAEALQSLHQSLQRDLPVTEQEWVARVEAERKRLMSCHDPLVDGSLGEGLSHDQDISVQKACSASKAPRAALSLFLMIRALRPRKVIELGTNVGVSSAYIAGAMRLNGQDGELLTLDASKYRQRLAKGIHSALGIDDVTYVEGLFTDTLAPSLDKVRPVDLAFIDGHHQYKPTLAYFDEILDSSAPDAVFVFDDIRWSDGMKKAWAEIQADDRLGIVVDLTSIGVCVRRQPDVRDRFVLDRVRVL